MAWKLRQPFEGDTLITVEGVDDTPSANCWADGSGNYVSNSITLKINSTDYVLASVVDMDAGYLAISVPSGVFIGPTTTIQVFANCITDPNSTTTTLTAKPVNFQVYSGVIKACSPQVALNSDIDEYIRLFFTTAAGDYFTGKINGVNLALSDFSYQSGDSGNIVVASGVFSRPALDTANATLISNAVYTGSPVLEISTPSTTKYFTTRFGYIELIFDNGNLLYNNYMISGEVEVASGTYLSTDVFTIEALPSQYIVRKNNVTLFTKPKTISYTVTGGTISPSTSTVGTAVAWNLPSSAGTYTFTGTVGDSVKFTKSVQLHSCADAVVDNYTGTFNTPYSGDVSANDVACVGESTYFELASVPSPVGGTPVVNQNGTFTFTPTTDFNSNASFTYNIRCGSSFGTSEVVDSAQVNINYFNPCTGVVANWVDNGETRCQNCTEEKQQIDLNGQCTGNTDRWVTNTGGSKCNTSPNYVPTGPKRCNNCINEQEVQDLNPCSPTYQQKTWNPDPLGTSCSSTAVWVDNGVFDCQSCVEKKQQRDNTLCSPTYNTTRWVDNPGGTQCNRIPNWQDTNESSCVNCIEYKTQKDISVCSSSYNTTRLAVNPTGTTCNREGVWQDTGNTRCQAGVHQKEQISTNPCSTEQQRWVNTGLPQCGCIVQIFFQNKCTDQGNIVGVTVSKSNVSESNRLVSYTPNVITFSADIGTFNYVVNIVYSSGMIHKINYNSYKCSPNI